MLVELPAKNLPFCINENHCKVNNMIGKSQVFRDGYKIGTICVRSTAPTLFMT